MEWIHVLAIVMPVILALVIGFFYNNSRLNDVNKRFDDVNNRFDDVNNRFDDVNNRIDDLRSDINQRFVVLHEEIREIKNFMMEYLKKEAGYVIRDK